MLEPLMMSKAIFDKLPKNQQDIILAVGTELEAFGRKGAQETAGLIKFRTHAEQRWNAQRDADRNCE
jgi:TRAP-type C4-dicarboxylate transport system substrate-binding protein